MTDPPPNATLRAIRISMMMSQDEFAQAIRAAGERLGHPNEATKRLVQRWERGDIATPRPVYARALEALTGMPLAALGFNVFADGAGGHDVEPSTGEHSKPPTEPVPASRPMGRNFSGIWLSQYDYYSSSRERLLRGQHFMVLIQHGNQITARSLPGSANSALTMDLSVDGNVVTGTWVERTDRGGYYKGARYHGAIQMLADPAGRKLTGKWVGFGAEGDVNTGPWELAFQDASTGKATLEAYNRKP
jgi:hypothetical protein